MSKGKVADPVKGHCPDCGAGRYADVVGHYVSKSEDEHAGVWGQTDYRILKCRGCDRAYFQIDDVFSEDLDHFENPDTGEWESYLPHKISYWPAPIKRQPPSWSFDILLADSAMGALFDDIYTALNSDLGVLAAIAVRTAFDRASELMGVDPALTFAKKLDELIQMGKISSDEKEILEVLIDAGSAAAHRGWRPKPRELDSMVSIIEGFIHRNFVLGDLAKALKGKVPPKPATKKKPKVKVKGK